MKVINTINSGIALCCLLSACEENSNSLNRSANSDVASKQNSSEPEKPKPRPPLSSLKVAHGDLEQAPPEGASQLASIVVAATIYKKPNTQASRIGYVRLGQKVFRDPRPTRGPGCKGDWYRVYPLGFMCTDQVTIDLEHPLVRAAGPGPAKEKPLPYRYGFVRATAPQYLRVPTKKEQIEREFGLLDHLKWFTEHKSEVQVVVDGANDVPLDWRGIALPGLKSQKSFVKTSQLSRGQLFGAKSDQDDWPFWLSKEGGRSIANVASYKVKPGALFADRVRRHTGLSFIESFNTVDEDISRRFATTVDLRLIPTTKVKPDAGSGFHGLEIPADLKLPFAWVLRRDLTLYRLIRGQDRAEPAEPAPRRALVQLSGKARMKGSIRYYQTLADKTRWLKDVQIGIVHAPKDWPEPAENGQKWIDISIAQQTLVLYEGKKAKYATLISSGRDRFGDPEKDLTTPLGDFRLESKHIAAAMDSNENSSVSGGSKARRAPMDAEGVAQTKRLKSLVASGKKLTGDDARRWKNIQRGRHPEYGVTRRRGSTAFELRDVPWIQYFSKGFALHGAYWHDVFGLPRSHGCVNLAPIDARVVFQFTDPPVPEGWHGINVRSELTGAGTWVHIRK